MRGAPTRRRLYLPTVAVVAATGVLAVVGWHQLGGAAGAARAVGQLRGEVTGPIVLGFLAVVLVAERLRPAVRRPFTSRGQMHDLVYLGLYALAVVPLIALIGAGFFGVMQRVAPWLVLPRLAFLPTWAFVVLEVVVLDAANWLAHLALHRFGALWRLHAVHHSQEELSILTSFRTHPLVHTAYLLTALPAFFFLRNGTLPLVAVAIYACLGALPHANVRWTYGPLGKVFISPAYHRLHHAVEGRIDLNLGIVLTLWDRVTGRAVFPVADVVVPATGLGGRPVPVEQGSSGHLWALWGQLTEVFSTPRDRRRRTSVSGGGHAPAEMPTFAALSRAPLAALPDARDRSS
jgi:sterol desaturase/sphingolipid hydroxylase (fatty acid hydroxylase superfamily)